MEQTQTFTTSGTWTAPVGVRSVKVECWGGGGSGGRGIYDYGGGGGAYAMTNSVTVVPGTGYSVTVGHGAVNDADTPTASQFWFGPCKAAPGNNGGTGGSFLDSNGDTKVSGGNGGKGVGRSAGGGGGGCAGANGSNSVAGVGGAGGAGANGGGAGGAGGSRYPANTSGKAGTVPGGGGGGAGGNGVDYGAVGVGANGRVRLTWTAPSVVQIMVTN